MTVVDTRNGHGQLGAFVNGETVEVHDLEASEMARSYHRVPTEPPLTTAVLDGNGMATLDDPPNPPFAFDSPYALRGQTSNAWISFRTVKAS